MRTLPAVRLLALAAMSAGSAARAEWVVSVYTGTSDSFNSNLHVTQPITHSDAVFEGVHWAAGTLRQAPYYGVRISYYASRSARLGATFDYNHYKMYAETEYSGQVHGVWNGAPIGGAAPLDTRIWDFEMAHGVNMTSLEAQYRWPAADSRWEPHLGGGLASYWPHAQGDIDGHFEFLDYQFGGLGAQVFGGTEYRLTNHVSLLVESKFNYGQVSLSLAPETRVQTTVNTLHVLGGFALHFR